MIALLTADIKGSRKNKSGQWLTDLKTYLSTIGQGPKTWEFYRGDAFQIEVKNPEESLRVALCIKAILRMHKLDARMAIGIGDKSMDEEKITESNGTAFVRSGELFEKLKPQKLLLALDSGNEENDKTVNLVLRLVSSVVSGWLPQSAEFVLETFLNPGLSQEEMGKRLGIAQAAVSRRQTRSQFDLIADSEKWFAKTIKNHSL